MRNAPLKARSRAPLRLGLAGGGTDLSPYCDEYGGAVLNVTISRFAHATVSFGGARTVLRACDLDCVEETDSGDIACEGRLALHRAVCRRIGHDFYGGSLPPLTLETMIDAPPGSGLGSSSALVVAMVEAFRVALELPLSRYEVARLAFEIERCDLSLAGGRQDQYAAAFGGINYIEFLPGERVVVNPLRLLADVLSEMEASLVLAFTGQSRRSEAIIADQIAQIAGHESTALDGMHRLKEEALEMKLAVLRGDFLAMAGVMGPFLVRQESHLRQGDDRGDRAAMGT